MPIQIDIEVLEADGPQGQAGTFISPPPIVKIDRNKDGRVHWRLKNHQASFEVRFKSTFSPFDSGELSVSDENNRQCAVSGEYHYAVRVVKGSNTWVIPGCPILDVGP